MKVVQIVIFIFFSSALYAQMSKRVEDRYNEKVFAAAKPAVGTKAPDLFLVDLNGRTWSLHELRGYTIVLIKGSYT